MHGCIVNAATADVRVQNHQASAPTELHSISSLHFLKERLPDHGSATYRQQTTACNKGYNCPGYIDGSVQKDATPLLTHWSHVLHAPAHRYTLIKIYLDTMGWLSANRMRRNIYNLYSPLDAMKNMTSVIKINLSQFHCVRQGHVWWTHHELWANIGTNNGLVLFRQQATICTDGHKFIPSIGWSNIADDHTLYVWNWYTYFHTNGK